MNQDKKVRYNFLDWLRCIGVCLIIYDHLGPLRNPDWFVSQIIDGLVNTPLGMIQHFGAFGVCLFFIISGFCLTASAPTASQFLYNKLVRIIVTLLISTLLFYCFNKIIVSVAGETYWSQFSSQEWLESSLLLCYLFGKDSVINGATWYLFPLMFMYVLGGLFFKVLKKNPGYFAVIMDVLFIGIWIYAKQKGYQGSHMQWLIFALIPVFGILIRAVCDKRISLYLFLSAFLLNYLVIIKSIRMFRFEYYSNQPYLISLAYAILLFGIFLLMERNMVVPKGVKMISDLSFSLYLLHMTFGGLIMTILDRYFGFTICFLIAVVVVFLLAWCHYVWIEKKAISILLKK